MRKRIFSTHAPILVIMALVLSPLTALADPAIDEAIVAASSSTTRQIPNAGTTSLRAGPEGVDGLQWPELPGGFGPEADALRGQQPRPNSALAPAKQGRIVNRSYSTRTETEGPPADENTAEASR